MPFVRRFTTEPSISQITAIEGVVIVDLAPTRAFNGVGSGTAALVGEFADMTYATKVSSAGAVSTSYQPVEIEGATDQYEKLGGFDSTIGDFGDEGGNGYVHLLNRKFSKLIVVPINLCSSYACRVIRQLPPNTSATSASPVVPVVAAAVEAGRPFGSGATAVRLGKRVLFTALPPTLAVTDAVSVAGVSAATQVITSATAAFVANSVEVGDIAVFGAITTLTGGDDADDDVGQYRVVTVDSAVQITVQSMTGANFAFIGDTARPLRIHKASDADSGGQTIRATTSGYTVPVRPTNTTLTQNTTIAPVTVPAAVSATSADPLSGLTLLVHPSQDIVYTAAVQAANVNSSTSIDTEYVNAIASLEIDSDPANTVNIVGVARNRSTIATAQINHCTRMAERGKGRVAVLGAQLGQSAVATLIGSSWPGSAANRGDRNVLAAPGVRQYVPAAYGTSIEVGDGSYVTDGILDVPASAFMLSILSTIPPQWNPGVNNSVTQEIMQWALGYQRAATAVAYTIDDFIRFKQAGVSAVRFDSEFGPEFQSGVNTNRTNIRELRCRYFYQESIAQLMKPYVKTVMTLTARKALAAGIRAYLAREKAAENITDYSVDDVSGNTAEKLAQGIFVIITRIQTTPTADYIVLTNTTGDTVQV